MKHILYTVALIFLSVSFLQSQCVGTQGQVKWSYWQNTIGYSGNMYGSDVEHLKSLPTFPDGPDGQKIINALSTPRNFDDLMVTFTRGFITVPQSGNVSFTITGDDQSEFYLSSDATAGNLSKIMEVNGYVGYDNIGNLDENGNPYTDGNGNLNEPNLFSGTIYMQAGQKYYFELLHGEGSGGDHVQIFWQNDFISQTVWTIISSQFLYDTCDTPCPEKGSTCNDGKSGTYEDVQDGACNCVGKPNTNNSCVGPRSTVQAYIYEGIPGSDLDDLYGASKYPAIPDKMEISTLGLSKSFEQTNIGVMIQAYLMVPETGVYSFNITANSEAEFFLSSDDTEANKNANYMKIDWWTAEFDHDAFGAAQSITNVTLNANQYYYVELNYKSENAQRFSVFWNGPHHDGDQWKRLPETYLLDYECELACIANGTACDDGDSYTASDQMFNCQCIGTPCDGTPNSPCDDPVANYNFYDNCTTSGQLGNRVDDMWLSCSPSNNSPNPNRNGRHWIHYDLGDLYTIESMHVWNYNVPGQLSNGFNYVTVDYSEDGVNWIELGQYNWPQASGLANYPGFQGPSFNQELARYIQITSLTGTTGCKGLGKVTFNIIQCAPEGTQCNDNNPLTKNDHFDDNCKCLGIEDGGSDCERENIFIYQNDIAPADYHAIKALTSEGKVLQSTDVNYRAGIEILMESGFEVGDQSSFLAEIEDCGGSISFVEETEEIGENLKRKVKPKQSLQVYAREGKMDQIIHFYIPKKGKILLEVLDQKNNLVASLADYDVQKPGNYYKFVRTKKLDIGVYLVKLTTKENTQVEKLIVVDTFENQ